MRSRTTNGRSVGAPRIVIQGLHGTEVLTGAFELFGIKTEFSSGADSWAARPLSQPDLSVDLGLFAGFV